MKNPGSSRRRRAALTAVLTASLAAACTSGESGGGEPADIDAMVAFAEENVPGVDRAMIEGACEEGTIDVLQGATVNGEEYAARFEEAFPCVDMAAIVNNDDDNLARFLAGSQQGQPADILYLGSDITMRDELVSEGLLLEYTAPEASKYQSISPGFVTSPFSLDQGIIYNTNSIDRADLESIINWTDLGQLTEPRFAGKRLGVVSPAGAGGGSYRVAYVIDQAVGGDTVAEIFSFLEVTAYPGSGPAVSALSSGEIDLLIGNDLNALVANGDGAPVEAWYPAPRSSSYTGVGIAAEAAHPNAAKMYVNFYLSEYGQRLLPELFLVAPANPDVRDTRPVAEEEWYTPPQEVLPYDPDDMEARYDEVVARYPSTS